MPTLNRRQFCRAALLSAAASATPAFAKSTSVKPTSVKHKAPKLKTSKSKIQLPDKRLVLRNLHTDESLDVIYWSDGFYIEDNIKALDHLLRDHRADISSSMDLRLFDSLEKVSAILDKKEIHIISGYRSPQTNEKLRQQGRGVAKNSFHIQARAIDIRVPKSSLKHTLAAAKQVHKGGIGCYAKSGFIHLDTGRPRSW